MKPLLWHSRTAVLLTRSFGASLNARVALTARPRLSVIQQLNQRHLLGHVRGFTHSRVLALNKDAKHPINIHTNNPTNSARSQPKHDDLDRDTITPTVAPIVVTSPSSSLTTGSGVLDAVITTFIGLSIVFVGGIAYVAWYKANVLDKMEQAFSAGYDPALELANRSRPPSLSPKRKTPALPNARWGEDTEPSKQPPEDEYQLCEDGTLRRVDQDILDRIVHGDEAGKYFMLLGPKGTGKTTMLLSAMRATHAEGASICDVHPDLEVFRLRLGKALNYEYHEDSQTGLFQRRDPREGGPALDIERALNKLEKVALRYTKRTSRPLVLIFNNVHFFRNDDAGREMLLQLQQHAESWAASGIVTMVFSSDDAWPFQYMRKTASRMHVVSVKDLTPRQAVHAAESIRTTRFPALVSLPQDASSSSSSTPTFSSPADTTTVPAGEDTAYTSLVTLLGGRLSYLAQAARHADMLGHAHAMLRTERAWLQGVIGLIPDCDDDVMDEQKWSSCSWLLLREFVKMRQAQEMETQALIDAGEKPPSALAELPLPELPYYRARQIMTRTDFIDELDRHNIIAIDINHNVTPDSLLLLHAAREVVEEEGFDDMLDNVRDRIDEIESLHRTRELTFKDVNAGDRIRLTVDKGGALLVESGGGNPS